MTDNKIQTELNGRLEQESPEPVEPQSQASAKIPSKHRVAAGRVPLFRR